jgi:large subunit ribosomal protein L24e
LLTRVVLGAKQFKMKRNPRKLKWTKAFRRAAGKEMLVDSTLQFAARRNVPTRYNRDLVAKTVTAMRRISEIRARRERVFYKRRMAGNKKRQIETARKLVETHGHLLPKMRGSERKRLEEEAEGVRMVEDVVNVNKNAERRKQKLRWTVDGEQEVEEDNAWEDMGDDAAMEGVEA